MTKMGSRAARLLAKLRAKSLTPGERSEQARKASKAASEKMTAAERKERAQKAAAARWAKRRRGK
jgi:hypothetical protein